MSVRLGVLAEYLLSRRVPRPLKPKESVDLHYVTMAGVDHWLLLRESLLSLYRTWTRLPRLTVVSDGSWTRDEFFQHFAWWPGQVLVVEPGELKSQSASSGNAVLLPLAECHPLGLKLLAIATLGLAERILFVDSDVLWYADPLPGHHDELGRSGLAVGVEPVMSYNEEIVREAAPELRQPPFMNSGMVCLNGPLCDRALLVRLLEVALRTSDDRFNEQTILAAANRTSGRNLPESLFVVRFDDAFSVRPRDLCGRRSCSRHYVGFMRHQFYRDALLLRALSIARSFRRAAGSVVL